MKKQVKFQRRTDDFFDGLAVLIEEYYRTKTQKAKNELTKYCWPVLQSIAKTYVKRKKITQHYQDVLSSASVGFLDALNRFDPEIIAPRKFFGFAKRRIFGAIVDDIRNGDGFFRSQSRSRVQRKIHAIDGWREMSIEKVADIVGVSVGIIKREVFFLRAQTITTDKEMLIGDCYDVFRYGCTPPDHRIEIEDTQKKVRKLISSVKLTPRQRWIADELLAGKSISEMIGFSVEENRDEYFKSYSKLSYRKYSLLDNIRENADPDFLNEFR